MTTTRREQLVVQAQHAHQGIAVSVRDHNVTIDEAEKYGGHDAGANPVEHLLAGIAAASLVVLRLVGEADVAESARLTVSGTLNVDRVMGGDDAPVFEDVRLHWEVGSLDHAERLRLVLPAIADRRPGQALIDAAGECVEEISIRRRAEAQLSGPDRMLE
ncbi:MAG: hypothetical protein JWR52_2534 [Marmoricola sp.]|nr:hypothetical protein [Marmoricola sp.]